MPKLCVCCVFDCGCSVNTENEVHEMISSLVSKSNNFALVFYRLVDSSCSIEHLAWHKTVAMCGWDPLHYKRVATVSYDNSSTDGMAAIEWLLLIEIASSPTTTSSDSASSVTESSPSDVTRHV